MQKIVAIGGRAVRHVQCWWPALLLTLAACEDAATEPPAVPDGGAADGGDAGAEDAGGEPSVEPTPPTPPGTPRLADWACPEGWQAVSAEEGEPWAFSFCRPPPPVDCEGATGQLPGDEGCRQMGGPCPPVGQRFHDEATLRELAGGAAGSLVYVDGEAEPDGDGSRDRPLTTITAALGALPPGDGVAVVALAPGTWEEAVSVATGVAVVGACTEQTTVRAPPPPEGEDLPYAVDFREGSAGGVYNLTVTGPGSGVRVWYTERSVSLGHVLLTDLRGAAIHHRQRSGEARLSDVVVRRVGPAPGSQQGIALTVHGGVRLVLERVVIDGVEGVGIYATPLGGNDPAELSLTDVRVRGCDNDPGKPAYGAFLRSVTRATLERVVLEEFGAHGILGGNAGALEPARWDLTDVALRAAPEGSPDAISLGGAVELSARRLLMEGLAGDAVRVGAEAAPDAPWSKVVLEDVAVLGGIDRGHNAGALAATPAAEVTVRRALVDGAVGLAWSMTGTTGLRPAQLVLEDVVVRSGQALVIVPEGETPPGMLGQEYGGGVWVFSGQLELARVVVEDVTGLGIGVFSGPGRGAASLVDVAVAGVRGRHVRWAEGVEPGPVARGVAGAGVFVDGRSEATGQRLLLTGYEGIGLAARGHPDGFPAVTLSDVTFVEGGVDPSGELAISLGASGGARVRLERASFHRDVWVSLLAQGWDGIPQTTVEVRQVAFSEVRASPCAAIPAGEPGTCLEAGQSEGAGVAVVVRDGAEALLEHFTIRGAALAGIVVALGGVLAADDGVVTDNPIGLNVLSESFDASRLGDGVWVYGNEQDVTRVQMPVPDAGALLSY